MKFPLISSIFVTSSLSSANVDAYGDSAASSSSSSSSPSSCVVPPPFDEASLATKGKPAIRIVMSITTGTFFAELIEGALAQARLVGATGVDAAVTSSDGDDVEQARLVSDAVTNLTTTTTTTTTTGGGGDNVGIITVDGTADSMCDAINAALMKNVSVVSFDFEGGACSPGHVLTSQDDRDMASLVLEQALLSEGGGLDVGYVSDLNYAPLVRRDEVWEAYKIDNDWTQVFFVEDAANYTSADALRSAIEVAISGSPRPPSFIYAPWDYLSINTAAAINGSSNASGIGVYGADVNDEDIGAMTAPGSQWLATAGGDPQRIGASLVRMAALLMAGELSNVEAEEGVTLTIPTMLITQDFLVTKNVTNMDILVIEWVS
ncbi:hypothetical protein ACHAW5_010972 [Stephanodiscus triporus]|uniref:Periplasmic binding protein domain-containing protein n=1 Tax=Stephanodiscus triporus TaxID=2934178 RepID=A0ABD3PPW5_9STRA